MYHNKHQPADMLSPIVPTYNNKKGDGGKAQTHCRELQFKVKENGVF